MAAAEFVIKVAIFPTDEIHHEFGRKYEQRLEEVTNGRIDVQLFPGHQLGGIGEMVDGVQIGTIEISMLPPGFFKSDRPIRTVCTSVGVAINADGKGDVIDAVVHSVTEGDLINSDTWSLGFVFRVWNRLWGGAMDLYEKIASLF